MAGFSPSNVDSLIPAAMTEAAGEWLGSLDPTQQGQALYGFHTSDRLNWHYVPRRRPGLPLKAMSEDQRRGIWRLFAIVLSDRGLAKARGVIEVEGILGALTDRPDFRDPANYALAIFGLPSADEPWSWRFEGHHLSLTFTIVPGVGVAATPSFFGSNPATVPSGHRQAGAELLVQERKLGFGLLHDLNDVQKRSAVIATRSLGDIVTGPGRETSLSCVQGLALREMSEAQRRIAMQLVGAFIGHLRPELAALEELKIRESGVEAIHFAWAGSLKPGSPHYFRLHGPSLLIEYDNTQNAANHVHTVWHNPANGFGNDMLKEHYARSAHD